MRELVLGILLVSSSYADAQVPLPLPLENERSNLGPVLTGEQIFKKLGISIPDNPVTTAQTTPVQTQAPTIRVQTQAPTTRGPLPLPELPKIFIDALDSQILGILQPAPETAEPIWPAYMDLLWPDIMLASRNLPEDRGIVSSMMAYMPIVRRIMELQARERGEELTEAQKYQLAWTNEYIPRFMEFAHNVSLDQVLYNDAPLNAAPSNELTDMIFSLLPDVSDIIINLKKKYGGFPGADKSLEIVQAFMPMALRTAEYTAHKEGRNLTKEEIDHLNFANKVVPPIMAYAQDVGLGQKKAFEQHDIMKLVNKAYQDEILHLQPKPKGGNQLQHSNTQYQANPQHQNIQHQTQHVQPQPQPQPQPQQHFAKPVVHQGPPPVHYYQPQHPVGQKNIQKRKVFKNRLKPEYRRIL